MMKSYKTWKGQNERFKRILPVVFEWSVRSLWRRKMGQDENRQMTRIGQMLGKGRGWNIFGRDSAQQGDDLMQALNNGDVGTFIKMAAPNSPFKQAYESMNRVKRNNPVNPGDLDQEDVHRLMSVLTNAYKGGNIPVKDLKELWRNLTGVVDNSGRINQQAAQIAMNNDVHTPLHILKVFFGIGGGIFSAPNNFKEIYKDAEDLLQKIYPQEYQKLYQNKFGYAPDTTNTPSATPAPSGGSTPPAAPKSPTPSATPVDSEIVNGLNAALAMQNDPEQMANAIRFLLVRLQGGTSPSAPTSPTP